MQCNSGRHRHTVKKKKKEAKPNDPSYNKAPIYFDVMRTGEERIESKTIRGRYNNKLPTYRLRCATENLPKCISREHTRHPKILFQPG